MIHRIGQTNSNKISEIAGSDYSFLKKLKLGGTGSMKILHIEGIDFINKFDVTSESQHYLSFEIRPNSLIGRTYGKEMKPFLINQDDLQKILFETYNLKIAARTGIIERKAAIVEMTFYESKVRLFVPRGAYKSIKKFFQKDWLKNKTEFTLNTEETKINSNGLLFDILTKILSL